MLGRASQAVVGGLEDAFQWYGRQVTFLAPYVPTPWWQQVFAFSLSPLIPHMKIIVTEITCQSVLYTSLDVLPLMLPSLF